MDFHRLSVSRQAEQHFKFAMDLKRNFTQKQKFCYSCSSPPSHLQWEPGSDRYPLPHSNLSQNLVCLLPLQPSVKEGCRGSRGAKIRPCHRSQKAAGVIR